jgi:hypothetical protein
MSKSVESSEIVEEYVRIWIDQEAIHMKAVDPHGDPVEITAKTARRLASILASMADKMDE